MRAVDTNVLVYAQIVGSLHHARARALLAELAGGPESWALPWPCLYEFLRVVTHPRVYHPPMPVELAREAATALLGSPSVVVLSETERHAEILDAVLRESGATGNLVHDAHIVALCREHGIAELVTGDRDFTRFAGVKVTDPFST